MLSVMHTTANSDSPSWSNSALETPTAPKLDTFGVIDTPLTHVWVLLAGQELGWPLIFMELKLTTRKSRNHCHLVLSYKGLQSTLYTKQASKTDWLEHQPTCPPIKATYISPPEMNTLSKNTQLTMHSQMLHTLCDQDIPFFIFTINTSITWQPFCK